MDGMQRLIPKSLLLVSVVLNTMTSCVTHAPASLDQGNTSEREEFWSKVLALLNEHNGFVTKERLEDALGFQFHATSFEPDATVYLVRAGKDGYFDANLVVYNDSYRASSAAENGAHRSWYLGWQSTSFGDPAKGECLTAARARADLIASGWTSPWERWGITEEPALTAAPSDRFRLPREGENPGPPVLPRSLNFFRQSDADSGHRDRLPRGELFGSGDLADSCVTGIAVTAAP